MPRPPLRVVQEVPRQPEEKVSEAKWQPEEKVSAAKESQQQTQEHEFADLLAVVEEQGEVHYDHLEHELQYQRWFDEPRAEEVDVAKLRRIARDISSHYAWTAVVSLVVVVDISRTLMMDIIDSTAFAQLGIVMLGILFVDLIMRIIAHSEHCEWLTDPWAWIDAVTLTLCTLDVLIDLNMPFVALRLLRFLRPLILIRSTIKKVADSVGDRALDAILATALGDILYITRDNTTFALTEGVMALQKTHIRQQFCQDMYSPLVIKGGFIEHAHIDMDSGRKTAAQDSPTQEGKMEGGLGPMLSPQTSLQENALPTVIIIVETLLLILGPGGVEDEEIVDIPHLAGQKEKLVEALARRTAMQVRNTHRRQKRAARPPKKRKSRSLMQKLEAMLGFESMDLDGLSIDIRNIEVRYEDPDKGMVLGANLGRGIIRVGAKGNAGGFSSHPEWRAKQEWEWDKNPAPPASLNGLPLGQGSTMEERKSFRRDLSAKSPSWGLEEESAALRVMATVCRFSLYCDHTHSDNWKFRGYSLFSDLLGSPTPKVHEAAQLFRRVRCVENWKLAATDALGRKGFKASNFISAVTGATRQAQGKTAVSSQRVETFWEQVQLHHYVLSPMDVSMHLVTANAGDIWGKPCQICDIRIHQINLTIDEAQVRKLRDLQKDIEVWMEHDRRLRVKPPLRLREIPDRRIPDSSVAAIAGERHQVARCWWWWACQAIARGIAPKGKLEQNLEMRRSIMYRVIYSSLAMEKCVACAKPIEKLRNISKGIWPSAVREKKDDFTMAAGKWTPQKLRLMQRVQFCLSLSDIIAVRNNVAKRYLNMTEGPVPYQHKPKDSEASKHAETDKQQQPVHLGITKHLTTGIRQLKQRDAGLQFKVRVNRVQCLLQGSAKASSLFMGDGEGEGAQVRLPIVRAIVSRPMLVSARCAPKEAWLEMKEAVNPRDSEAHQGPLDGDGACVEGWQCAHMTAMWFEVTAPGLRKELRKLVTPSQRAASQAGKTLHMAPGGNVVALQVARWLRPNVENGNLDESGAALADYTGAVCVHCCQVDLVEFSPLTEKLLNILKPTPLAKVRADDLQLGDCGARLRFMRRQRQTMNKQITYFEKATGKKAGSTTNHGTDWTVFGSLEGAEVCMVRRYTERSYMLLRTTVPRWHDKLYRTTWPSELGGGCADEFMVAELPDPLQELPRVDEILLPQPRLNLFSVSNTDKYDPLCKKVPLTEDDLAEKVSAAVAAAAASEGIPAPEKSPLAGPFCCLPENVPAQVSGLHSTGLTPRPPTPRQQLANEAAEAAEAAEEQQAEEPFDDAPTLELLPLPESVAAVGPFASPEDCGSQLRPGIRAEMEVVPRFGRSGEELDIITF